MTILLVALALAAPASGASPGLRAREAGACVVDLRALDAEGRPRSARRVSASAVPVVIVQGRVSDAAASRPLLIDVFNPRGQRYQTLVARPPERARGGRAVRRTAPLREAALPLAGSSIAWTSMFGLWRVEPRLEGSSRPCGRARHFTVAP